MPEKTVRKRGRPKIRNPKKIGRPSKDVLLESEEIFRSIFDLSPYAITLVDLAGRIVDCNHAALIMNGATKKEQLLGTNSVELLAPADRPRALANLKRTLTEGRLLNVEYTFLDHMGRAFPGELSASVIHDAAGKPYRFIGVIQDISERKRVEETVRNSSLLYRSTIDALEPLIHVVDRHLNITLFNKSLLQWCRRLHIPAENPIGMNVFELFPFLPEKVRQEYMDVFATGKISIVDDVNALDDQTIFTETRKIPVLEGGMVSRVVTVVTDISERKRVEEALRAEEAKMRSIFQAAPVGIGLVSNRVLMDVNDRLCEIVGYAKDELIGKSARMLYPSDQDFEFVGREKYRQIAERGWGTVETRFKRKDGQLIDVLLSSSPLDRANLAGGVTFTVLDISESKRSEEELRLSESRLRQIIDLVPHFIFARDSEGRFILVNKAVAEAYGTSVEKLTGKTDADFASSEDEVRRFRADDMDVIHSGKPKWIPEETITDSSGTIRHLSTTKIPFTFSGATFSAVLGVSVDISARKKAEAELQLQKTHFEELFQFSPEGVVLLNKEERVVACNREFSRMFGYTPAEASGRLIDDLIVPADLREEGQRLFREVSEGKIVTVETVRRKKDGGRMHVAMLGTPIRYGQDLIGVYGIYRDISDRIASDRALRESEEKFRLLFEKSNDAIFLIDAEGVIINCNDKAGALLRCTKTDILGRHNTAFVAPDYREDSRQKLELLKSGMTPKRYEKVFIAKGGKPIPVEISATPVLDEKGHLKWVQSVVQDISERKHAEELQSALYRISEETSSSKDIRQLYRAIHKIVGELMDVRNFYIALWDKSSGMLEFPYFIDEFDPPPAPKKLGKGMTEYVLRTRQPILATQESMNELERLGEVELIGTDCVDWLGVPLNRSEKETFGVVVVQSYHPEIRYREREKEILTFVSQQIATAIERKRAEENLRDTEAQFQHLQRIESIGTLMGSIAHDYNNIWTSILGNAQLLEFSLQQSDSPLLKYIQAIRRASESGAGLVQQLLDFSKKEGLQPEIVHINKVIADWQEILARVIGDKIRIVFELAEDVAPVRIDPGKLRQVLMNLVVNARDAMPEKGTITVGTAKLTFAKPQILRYETIQPGDYVRLAVRDTGKGMAEGELNQIFKPFFTTKERNQGTGLGLSIVKKIVEQAEGVIDVESQPAQGTVMSIYLPTYASGVKTDKAPQKDFIYSGRGETILIVEDDVAVREMLRNWFSVYLGYTLREAGHGREALEWLQKERIDLVITDIKMPEMDGINLITEIKSLYPQLAERVIAITGYADINEKALRDMGFQEVVYKPVKIEELSALIYRKLYGGGPGIPRQ